MFIQFHLLHFPEIIFPAVTTLIIFGHNLWLIGKNAPLQIRVEANTGDNFPESDSAVKPERIADFRIISSNGIIPVTNYRIEENSLVTDIPTTNNKSCWIALALYAHPITLDAKKFAGYIAEEDAREFVKSNFIGEQTSEPQRESYTKFAKVLVEVNEAQTDDIFKLAVGHQLEIIPQISPSKIGDSQKLPILVLFQGEPIKGLRVSSGCEHLNDGKYLTHTLTNENGLAEVDIQNTGHWFIRTHFIRPHLAKESFDWESFWASITFRV